MTAAVQRSLHLIDLRKAARTRDGRRGRRLPRPPRMLHPLQAERDYVRGLQALVAEMHGVVVRDLIPRLPAVLESAESRRPRTDSYDIGPDRDRVQQLLDLIRSTMFGVMDDKLEVLVKQIAIRTAISNAGQIDKVFKDVLGVDLFRSEPWLEPEMRLFVAQNVSLVRSVGQRYYDDLSGTVYQGARSGATSSAIGKQIAERFGVTQRRARLIARDQVSKFNGQLSQLRQTQAGVTRYTWRTSRDERVRHSHRAMEGRICDWDDPPVVDGVPANPGEPINCRCYAEPVMEDLLP